MFKISITKNNVITNQAQFETEESVHTWLKNQQDNKSFGRNSGEYNINELTEQELLTEISRKPLLDLSGNEIGTLVTIPNQYEVIIEDVTQQLQLQKESQEALAYLASTDYLVIRKSEAGLDYPQEIKNARTAARLKVLK